MLTVTNLRTEYLVNPVGIDAANPRFSWKLESDRQNVLQRSYHIVAKSGDRVIWDSGEVFSDETRFIRYSGEPLTSLERVSWTVSVRMNNGDEATSGEGIFEMGLLNQSDWHAKWIQPEREIDFDAFKETPLLRKEFTVKPGLARAEIAQSAHGIYRFWLNGTEGTKDRFNPGFTSYQHRVQYQIYDITCLLHEGVNAWTVQLGDGWWRGYTGGGNRNNFGFYLSFIGQIMLTYADGSHEVIGSDETFKVSHGIVLRSDMKVGEIYDATQDSESWKRPGFDVTKWQTAIPAVEYNSLEALVPSRSVPVRTHEEFTGTVLTDADGSTVIDFGQNIAGVVKMRLHNTAPGQWITIYHGEGMKDGRFSTANIEETTGDPFQQVIYICRGAEEEIFEPYFSVSGFRYIKIEGMTGEVKPEDFKAVAIYSDLDETGHFECSNELVTKLASNCLWSQKSNFLDVPTDCPTRERSSWSGDAEVYCRTAADFMNVYPFFEKWMQDLSIEQFEDGCVGNTFPSTNALHNEKERERMIEQGRFIFAPPTLAGPKGNGAMMDGAAGWGDVATILPWTMYLCYGDRQILVNQYASAKKWVEFCRRNAKNPNPLYADAAWYKNKSDGTNDGEYIYDTHFHWGEWMEPDAAENNGPDAFNPPDMARRGNPIVATAYLYYSASILADWAKVLGKTDDAFEYSKYADNVKRAYNRYLIKADGTILPGRQAPYVRVLAFGLADAENAPKIKEKLAEAVKDNDFCLNTGFLSTPYLLDQLVDAGYPEYAYRVLQQTKNPSWLHAITLGATTTLESWDGIDRYSNSFNHYSYGAVSSFLFSYVAGIRLLSDNPGFRRFEIKPIIGGGLTHASAKMDTAAGTILSSWKKTVDGYTFDITVPVNTQAFVTLPANAVDADALAEKYGAAVENDKVTFQLGSGSYTI